MIVRYVAVDLCIQAHKAPVRSLHTFCTQAIEENMDLRPETPLSRLMEHDFWGVPLRSNMSNKSFRPLTVLSFRINYAVHQLDPFGEALK